MEAKLKEYRALRRRQQMIDNAKEKLEESKQKLVDFFVPKVFRDMGKEKEEEVLLMENEELEPVEPPKIPLQLEEPSEIGSETSELESFEVEREEPWGYFVVKVSIFAVIWITLYLYFLKLQFGAVFFVVSALIGIFVNTRTRPKKRGEVSAYSVFNENCVSIDGTLKAEQFEKEIRYGAGTVRSF